MHYRARALNNILSALPTQQNRQLTVVVKSHKLLAIVIQCAVIKSTRVAQLPDTSFQ